MPSFVWMTKTGLGVSQTTQEAFDGLWAGLGWTLTTPPDGLTQRIYRAIISQATPPPNPGEDELWMDESVSPRLLKQWDGSTWQTVGGGGGGGGGTAGVTSINGTKTGAVTLAKSDVGLGSVDNTSDNAKPLSAAAVTALNLKADASRATALEATMATTVKSASVSGIVVSTDPNVALANGQLGIIVAPTYQTYFTNFSEYTAGAAPSGWTPRWITSAGWQVIADGSAGVTGGKVLAITAGSGRRGISWDLPSADAANADLEIVFKHKVAVASGSGWPSAMFRASGAAGAENGYIAGLGYASAGGQAFTNISRFSAGANQENHVNGSYPTNVYYCTRVRAVGSLIQARTWLYQAGMANEPSTWDNTMPNTYSNIVAGGWVGLWAHGVVSETKHFDWIGVATGGGTAPVGT